MAVAGSQHSNCVTKLSDIWYLDTDREDSNIWEPFDTILIFTGLARPGTWTWTTHELDQGAGARNLSLSQQQMCLTKSRCWEETETKEGILLVSLAKYERILFSVQLFRITGGHFNPCPRPRLPAAKYFEWDYWQLSDLRWAVCGTQDTRYRVARGGAGSRVGWSLVQRFTAFSNHISF